MLETGHALEPTGRQESEFQIVVQYETRELRIRQYDNYLTLVRHLEFVAEDASVVESALALAHEHLPWFEAARHREATDEELNADPTLCLQVAIGADAEVDPATEDLILRALKHVNTQVRGMAAQAVNTLVTHRLIGALAQAYHDEDPGQTKVWMGDVIRAVESDPALSVALQVDGALNQAVE